MPPPTPALLTRPADPTIPTKVETVWTTDAIVAASVTSISITIRRSDAFCRSGSLSSPGARRPACRLSRGCSAAAPGRQKTLCVLGPALAFPPDTPQITAADYGSSRWIVNNNTTQQHNIAKGCSAPGDAPPRPQQCSVASTNPRLAVRAEQAPHGLLRRGLSTPPVRLFLGHSSRGGVKRACAGRRRP